MGEQLMNAEELAASLAAMTNSLAAMISNPEEVAIVGIRTRGAFIAQRIHKILALEHEWDLPVGVLDITLYRDDLSQLASFPLVRKTQLDFDVSGKLILLIDDVLYTGRTIRSAIDEIIDFGRPKAIRLAVLVDRGGREYPIQPDYAAQTIESHADQVVKVSLNEVDGEDRVTLAQRPLLPPAP